MWHVPEEWVGIEKGRSLGSSGRAKHMLERRRLSQSCPSLMLASLNGLEGWNPAVRSGRPAIAALG